MFPRLVGPFWSKGVGRADNVRSDAVGVQSGEQTSGGQRGAEKLSGSACCAAGYHAAELRTLGRMEAL